MKIQGVEVSIWTTLLLLLLHLGVLWDQGLKFDKQINAVISPCFFQLRLLSKIKYFLSVKTLEIAIHALITTRLDYCNYLCNSKSSIAQLVQNAAAIFLKGQHKCDQSLA